MLRDEEFWEVLDTESERHDLAMAVRDRAFTSEVARTKSVLEGRRLVTSRSRSDCTRTYESENLGKCGLGSDEEGPHRNELIDMRLHDVEMASKVLQGKR